MILLINISKEKLHYFEFVKPIEKILDSLKIERKTIHYKELKQEDLEESKKVIICGTSLKDNDYLNHLDKFGFVKKLDKPILGICGGMQIIGKAFGSELEKTDEIGQIRISFEKEFLGLNGEHNICSLHNHSINLSEEFEAYAKSKCVQAMKHKEKEIYATLFHPEVLNKRLIINFCLI